MTKTNNNLSNIIDDKTEVEEISKKYSKKYDVLYNSVGYSINDLNKLTNDINIVIDDKCATHPSTINAPKVKDAI